MEVMVGAREDAAQEETCRRFLGSFRVLPVTQAVAERAVHLRCKHRLKLPDAIVFATALEASCLLVTRNTRDFPAHDASVRFPYE